MQRRTLFLSLFAAGAGALALPAMAKDHKDDWPPSAQHGHGNGHGRDKPPKPDRHDNGHHNARGHAFGRGRPLPGEYRGRQYVVTDYRRYRLPPPARHQHWVRVGPDFVLVVATSGLIVNVVFGR